MKRLFWLAVVTAVAAGCGKDTIEPPADLVEFEPSHEVRRIWSYKIGRGTERLRLGLAPASDNETTADRGPRLFVGSYDGKAAALDLETGDELWEIDTDHGLSAGPAYGEGVVVFGTADGGLLALRADTGDELWYRSLSSEVLAPPVVDRGIVLFRTTDGRLGAATIGDGRERWSVEHSVPTLTLRGSSAPLIVGNLAAAGFDNGRVGVYEVETGLERWEATLALPTGRTELDRLVDVGTDIEAFGGQLYAATFQGRAGSFAMATGTGIWQRDMSSFVGLGVDADHVYVTNDVGTVIALARTTDIIRNRSGGDEMWRQEALRLRDVTAATRFLDTVVVGDYDGYLHWLDPDDGSFAARARAASAQVVAQPLVIGETVVVQSEDGTIAAFQFVEEEVEEDDDDNDDNEQDDADDEDVAEDDAD
jgi:outer membrane protein assembly factor BamB